MNKKLSNSYIKSIIESLLFIYGEPLSAQELKQAIDPTIDIRVIKKCAKELQEDYKKEDRGLTLFILEDKYQIGTKSELSQYVEKIISPHKKKTLTKAALETLTIIAYKQPITKIEVEDIRGVKSDAVFTTLINNELIVVCGVANKIGRPKLYKTTDIFLKTFGLKSVSELPELDTFKNDQMTIDT